eukprot:3212113-Rhodomonas_salina.3
MDVMSGTELGYAAASQHSEVRYGPRLCCSALRPRQFFSGDTCQTIASGVGFRFEDLRSLFKAEQDLQTR